MYRTTLVATSLILTLLFALNAAAQQPPPKSYNPKQMRELGGDYKTLQKELQAIEKQRAALEGSLKNYNDKMQILADQMAKTEEKIDFASGIYSYDPRFQNTTQQAQALHMAYDLKSSDLMTHIVSEKFQLDKIKNQVADKYNHMKQSKSK